MTEFDAKRLKNLLECEKLGYIPSSDIFDLIVNYEGWAAVIETVAPQHQRA